MKYAFVRILKNFIAKKLTVIYFDILLVKNKYKKSYNFYNIISVKRVTLVMIF